MSAVEMSASSSDYKSCFDLSPVAQVILDRFGDIVDVNAQACTLLGHQRSAMLGRHLADLVHQDDRPQLDLLIEQSTARQQSFGQDCRVVSPEHGVRWFGVQCTPSYVDGKTVAWYTVFSDITERKRQDAWLVHRNALLTALSHNLPGMIYVFRPGPDKGGCMEFISEGVRDLFGATPDEALASPWVLYSRVLPEDIDKFFQQRDDAISASARLHSEFRVRNAKGELRWCSADSVAGLDAEGSEVRCGYISDITEHKLYLEAKMAADTAERASRAKSEFLSRMSHELRTPLNAVIGFAQILKIEPQSRLSESQLNKVDLIERAGAHLLAVISDVLDLSRIEAGDLPMSLEPVEVANVVHDALAMVAEPAAAVNVTLNALGLEPALAVRADRVRLRQVMVNLLSNAIKYNRPRGSVHVRAHRGQSGVFIEVSDTGLGLSDDQQAHLFEPFNRLGAEQSSIEGTGIGLVIVHRLVELMGGHMAVQSQQRVGTTFTIGLPPADLAPTTGELSSPESSAPVRQATVLYAEDNEVNVILVRQIMALRPHWKLVVAGSGAQALKMIRQARPDLLLLDMHLGDMGGLELVDMLEQDAATSGLPKVALSADAMPDRIHEAKERGFSAYLTKPLDVAKLLRCLDEVLAGAHP